MGLEIHSYEEVGAVVLHEPITGVSHRVSLRSVAEKMIAKGKLRPLSETDLQYLDSLGSTEVGASGLKKISAAAKKAVAPVKKVAKAVGVTAVVKGVAKVASKAVPFPASLAVTGAASAAKLGKKAKTDPKAKKVAAAAKSAAKGKTTPAQLTAIAKANGIAPQVALEAAGVAKVADMAAAGDPKAKAAISVASQLTSPDVKEQQKAADTIAQLSVVQAAQQGDAAGYLVTTPDGQKFRTLVVPAGESVEASA